MADLVPRLRSWLDLDKKPIAKQVSKEDLARAEDEGMVPPDVETPSPHLEDKPI